MLTKEKRYKKYREIVKEWWLKLIDMDYENGTKKPLTPYDREAMFSDALQFIDKNNSFKERKEFHQRMLKDEDELVSAMEKFNKENHYHPPFLGSWFYGNLNY